MLEDLTQDLIAAKQDLRRKKDLESSLARARQSLRRQRQNLWKLRERLTAERADVEALEGLSLEALFHTLLGDKGERIHKERQELLAAKLRYDECQDAITALEQEVGDLLLQVEQLGDVEARYDALLRSKEKILHQTGGEAARQLLKLSEAIGDARSDARELREAMSAGNAVLNSLNHAFSALRGAERWGTVDLLGGGILTTVVKHGRVDEARSSMHQAQQHLRRFHRELGDLESDVSVGIPIRGFETFADYFFDGLIADWVVQSGIRSSLDRTLEMRNRVDTTIRALRRELSEVRERTRRLERPRRELVEQA